MLARALAVVCSTRGLRVGVGRCARRALSNAPGARAGDDATHAANSAVDTLLAGVRAAQLRYAEYTQQQVDRVFMEVAVATSAARVTLAEHAWAETKRGVMEDKVIKNHFASEVVANRFAASKTCGVIAEDVMAGVDRVAFPLGVIAAVTPVTNPTSTIIYKALMALKTRNALVVAPHPASAECAAATVRIIDAAATRAGAPPGLVACLVHPSLDTTNALMRSPHVNLIWATGGQGLVRSALATGKPCIVAGEGNCPAVIDELAHVPTAVSAILQSKTFDWGMTCASEQAAVVVASAYDAVLDELRKRGAVVLSDAQASAVGARLLSADGRGVNAEIVGQSPERIAALAGIPVPPETVCLVGEADASTIGPGDPWSHEKLAPVLALYRAADIDEAVDVARRLVLNGGVGHTAALHTGEGAECASRVRLFEDRVPAGTLLCNEPSLHGAIGDIFNPVTVPRLSIPSSTSVGESAVTLERLLAVKTLSRRHEHLLWVRVPPALFFSENCLPEAMKHVHCKRALVVTDEPLVRLGLAEHVTSLLRATGAAVEVFDSVEPDPSVQTAMRGVERMRAFRPDCIVAFGGGSPIDCAKVMKLMHLHPTLAFEDLRLVFMDITKRLVRMADAQTDAHALPLVVVPTTSGTGSEVTPFAVIRDARTGRKYPLADYCMTPQMAVCDPSFTFSLPSALVAQCGYDALTHAIEAYVSVLASDFTRPMALQAARMLHAHLLPSYRTGAREARRAVHYASTLAGYAIANSFVGVAHSIAHQIGAAFDLSHGVACALALPSVVAYNASDAPFRQTAFPQYRFPHASESYAEIATALGLPGASTADKVAALVHELRALRAQLDLPATLRDAGVDADAFGAALPQLARNAFEDQCTLSNPRYPLVAELRALMGTMYAG
jgi:acetaldehyde dehydrogenase/alcohol dehydrogenase